MKEEPIDAEHRDAPQNDKAIKIARSTSSASSSIASGNKTQKDNAKKISRQMSGESVYEDAVSDSNKNSNSQTVCDLSL